MKRIHPLWLAWALLIGSCTGTTKKQPSTPAVEVASVVPPSGERRELIFPKIKRKVLGNGLELDAVQAKQLPLFYAQVAIRSGGQTDPKDLPGLSKLVAAMLKEGTLKRSGAELAEKIEFLGADLWAGADEQSVVVGVRALSRDFGEVMALLSEVVTQPSFRSVELNKLKKRELDRLALSERDPGYVGRRAYYGALYGDHPYARVDTTPSAIRKVNRSNLVRWHRRHMVAANALVVVVGDVTPEHAEQTTSAVFANWRKGSPAKPTYAAPPKRTTREILIVDRPGSVQSVISIGNLAIPRKHDDWIPLTVANQVLGGSAASRLFMDLREKRSLTYGAYSRVAQRNDVGGFTASASVRTDVTAEAVGAFLEHLQRIVSEPTPPNELKNAHQFLSDSFPLKIDTTGKIANLITDLRLYDLPDDYWQSFGPSVRAVLSAQAMDAAKKHIRPDKALVVVVGQAADFAQDLRKFGPVKVVAQDGEVKAKFPALPQTPL